METISIDGKDLYEEYGFILASSEIQQPTVQTKFVDVPMRDGSIDMTNVLSDTVRYKDRTIKVNLLRMEANENVLTALSNFVHGQKRKIIFSNDIGYFYVGRISITSVKRSKGTMTVTLTATCEPFKYDVTESDVDWEWDVFDLENGVINESNDLVIMPGRKNSFTLICRRDREFPTFEWLSMTQGGSPCEMTYNGKTYSIPVGISKLYNVFFEKGENALAFKGSGILRIKYRGGSL